MSADLSHNHVLAFDPKWWWDPIPPFLREHLTVEIAQQLVQIQLKKQLRMLELEQQAVKESMEVLSQIG